MSRTTIELYRGDDEECTVRVFEKQNDNSIKPYDLSNVARLDLYAVSNDEPVIRLSSTTGDIDILDAKGGVILVKFRHEVTQGASWNNAGYDLQAISNSGKVKTVVRNGTIILGKDYTPSKIEN